MTMPTTADAEGANGVSPPSSRWGALLSIAPGAILLAAALGVTVRFEPVRVGWRPFNEWTDAWQPQSLVLLAAALALVALSGVKRQPAQILATVACIVVLVMTMVAAPLDQRIRMGDSGTYTSSRRSFDFYTGAERVRFEAHLSSMLLRGIDRRLGATRQSPRQAFTWLARLAAVWFGAMLLAVAWTGGWSPSSLRYLALVVAAPATLMYFGYRELGYLSLNAAVVPLVFAGFRGRRVAFEGGSALAGLGAALHGFGLLSLAGAALSALGARLRFRHRVRLLVQAFAIGTSVYLIWVFVYVAGLRLDVVPGHAASIPWRPLLVDRLAEHRINYAIMSPRGAADVLLSAWMAGAPLVVLALASLRRRTGPVRPVLLFVLPSALFLCAFWPVQGLAVEADLVFAAFPGFYALAWLASRSSTATRWGIVLLASGHVVFWRVMLSDLFVNSRLS